MLTALVASSRLALGLVLVFLPVLALAEGGSVGVYFDQHAGKPTASGEPYRPDGFTAAHVVFPLGAILRVRNEANGATVNVRVNDRKQPDGRVLYLSGAAGRVIGLSPGQSTSGRITLLPPFASVGRPQGQVAAPQPPRPGAARRDVERQARVHEAEARRQAARARENWSGSTGGAAAGRKPGFFQRLFGGMRTNSPSAHGGGSSSYQYPEPAYTPDGRVVPMSAPSGPSARAPDYQSYAPARAPRNAAGYQPESPHPQPAVIPDPVPPAASSAPRHSPQTSPPRSLTPIAPSSSVAVASSRPYRVQFGAFRKLNHAEEFRGSMGSSGIPTMVVQSTANELFLVVGRDGFATAGEAQRWIDYEGGRRGWQERPVVIR